MTQLVVTNQFGGHDRGAIIDDPKAVEEILSGPNRRNVQRVPEPEPEAAPKAPAA
jgi:hypothetical protein